MKRKRKYQQVVNSILLAILFAILAKSSSLKGQDFINFNLPKGNVVQLDSINDFKIELFKNLTYNINLKYMTEYTLNQNRSKWINYKISYIKKIVKDYNKINEDTDLKELFEKINYFDISRDTNCRLNIFKSSLQLYQAKYKSNYYLDLESNNEYITINDGGFNQTAEDTIYFACLDKNTIRYLSGNLFLSSLKSLIKDSITAMILESSSSEKYKYEIDVYKSIFKQLLDVRKINYESLESKKGVLFIKLRNRKIKLSSKNYFYFCNLLIDGSNLSLFY